MIAAAISLIFFIGPTISFHKNFFSTAATRFSGTLSSTRGRATNSTFFTDIGASLGFTEPTLHLKPEILLKKQLYSIIIFFSITSFLSISLDILIPSFNRSYRRLGIDSVTQNLPKSDIFRFSVASCFTANYPLILGL